MEEEKKAVFHDVGVEAGQTYWEKRKEIGFLKAFWLTWQEVMFRPNGFFSRMSISGGWKDPLLFTMAVFYAAAIMGVVLLCIIYPKKYANVFIIFAAALVPVFEALIIFPQSIIMHAALWITGARNGFLATFRVILYSEATNLFIILCLPMFLLIPLMTKTQLFGPLLVILQFVFGLLMISGLVMIFLWQVVLHIVGFRHAHKMSLSRAILAYVIVLAISLPYVLSEFKRPRQYRLNRDGSRLEGGTRTGVSSPRQERESADREVADRYWKAILGNKE